MTVNTCVRFGFAPGVDPRYHAAFEERFGIPMIDAWAMTETGAARGGDREPRAAPCRPVLLRPRAALYAIPHRRSVGHG